VRDRFVGAGIVAPALARRLGLTGLAGRASGQAYDLRLDQPWAPYDRLKPNKMGRTEGDVAARVALRFDELLESVRLIHEILERAPNGPHTMPFSEPPDAAFGLGLIEGWRGPARIRDERFSLQLTSSLPYLVVYTPARHDYFCVEPVSHVSNAIHMADPAAHGLVALVAGATIEAWMRLDIAVL